MRRIIVDYGTRREIMQLLDCTYPTVRTALQFGSDTELAQRIRKVAMEKGGTELITI